MRTGTLTAMSAVRAPMPIFLIAAVLLSVLCGAWIPLEALPITSVPLAITSEPGGALFGHALISIAIFGGLLAIALKKRVLPLPQIRLLLPLAFLMLTLIASILFSEYKHLSLAALFEWITYAAALILTVGTVGRGNGVRMVLGAITGAIALMAIHGILEWIGSAQDGNPSWRIFAHTLGPNAAAAFFAIGAMTGLGLLSSKERLGNLLAGVAVFLCLVALIFTGSKGGVLATIAATAFYCLWTLILSPKKGGMSTLAIAVICVAAFGFTTMAVKRFTPQGTTASSRIAQAGESQEQSAGFRQLLWKGTAKLIAERPQGYGLGTYRFYSARPGLTTQTQLAHNSYLQLAMEASPLALVAFLAFLVVVAGQVFRGTRSQPAELQSHKAAVTAAIAAVLIHSMIDSDLHIFGVGILFFILCGLAIQLSTDLSAPEFLHPGLRNGITITGIVVPFAMLYFGVVDLRHGLFLNPKQNATAESVKAELDSLVSFAPLDSRVSFTNFRFQSQLGASISEQAAILKKAIAQGPTLQMLRAMARLAMQDPKLGDPETYLDRVLSFDPNNLLALEMKLDINRERDPAKADKIAQAMLEVETKPYFQVRSLPEIVTLETYRARSYLATKLTGDAKAEMLLPAVKGFAEYANITVPKIVQFAKAEMDGGFGGITLEDAKANLEFGQKLVADYSSVRPGDKEGASASASLTGALASLSQ